MGKDENKSREEVEPVAQASSRLGKEAKIGIVVIALLLLGLGTAITMRLMRSSDDSNWSRRLRHPTPARRSRTTTRSIRCSRTAT